MFTTADETFAALRVAAELGRAMAVPLTLIHIRAIPYPLPLEAPAGISPIETSEFMTRVRSEDIEVRMRVYLCRRVDPVIPMIFRSHSLIVIGGRRNWWRTPSKRLRKSLEAAGHFVVFVDAHAHEERGDA
jgi:hypothetical protein